MRRFIEGEDRKQVTLPPECLDDYVGADNPVRIVDVFVDQLELRGLGFTGVEPAETGRPSYHPAVLLKIYIYGYLNRVQSSRRLEREAQRNVELMWLTGRVLAGSMALSERVAAQPSIDGTRQHTRTRPPRDRKRVSTQPYMDTARLPS